MEQDATTGTLGRLPNELLLKIAELLEGISIICFSLTCRRFADVCLSLRAISFENDWSALHSLDMLKEFLSLRINHSVLVSCNFNSCDWVPAALLLSSLKKCVNLTRLSVCETKLNCSHLSQILPKCLGLVELAFTLGHCDLWLGPPGFCPISFGFGSRDPAHLLAKTHFSKNLDALRRLNRLELVVKTTLQDMTVLVSFCDSLKELFVVLARAPNEDADRPSSGLSVPPPLDTASYYPLVTGSFRLNAVTFLDLEQKTDDAYRNHQLPKGLVVFKTDMSELGSFWYGASPCPASTTRFSSLSFCHAHHLERVVEDWRLNVIPDGWNVNCNTMSSDLSDNPLDGFDLSAAHSICEPNASMMRNGMMVSRAKLVCCHYDSQGFSSFCDNHPLLEVLRLRNGRASGHPTEKSGWNSKNWTNLSKLRSLSIEPRMIVGQENRTRKRKFGEICNGESATETALLQAITKNCLTIQDLEIGDFSESDATSGARCAISGEDLRSISLLKGLKSLTLVNFHTSDGAFLGNVLKSCQKLEVLRLKNVGPTGLCCYTKNLCSALPHARNLTTLSIFQRNITPLIKLLDALGNCSALTRLGLVCPSDAAPFKWTADEFSRYLVQFTKKCYNLVAFFCVLSVPKSHCAKAGKVLHQEMAPNRPVFRADVQCSDKLKLEYESRVIPLVHQQVLVRFRSKIGILPHDCKCFLI